MSERFPYGRWERGPVTLIPLSPVRWWTRLEYWLAGYKWYPPDTGAEHE